MCFLLPMIYLEKKRWIHVVWLKIKIAIFWCDLNRWIWHFEFNPISCIERSNGVYRIDYDKCDCYFVVETRGWWATSLKKCRQRGSIRAALISTLVTSGGHTTRCGARLTATCFSLALLTRGGHTTRGGVHLISTRLSQTLVTCGCTPLNSHRCCSTCDIPIL